jgi:hypothetical protein
MVVASIEICAEYDAARFTFEDEEGRWERQERVARDLGQGPRHVDRGTPDGRGEARRHGAERKGARRQVRWGFIPVISYSFSCYQFLLVALDRTLCVLYDSPTTRLDSLGTESLQTTQFESRRLRLFRLRPDLALPLFSTNRPAHGGTTLQDLRTSIAPVRSSALLLSVRCPSLLIPFRTTSDTIGPTQCHAAQSHPASPRVAACRHTLLRAPKTTTREEASTTSTRSWASWETS